MRASVPTTLSLVIAASGLAALTILAVAVSRWNGETSPPSSETSRPPSDTSRPPSKTPAVTPSVDGLPPGRSATPAPSAGRDRKPAVGASQDEAILRLRREAAGLMATGRLARAQELYLQILVMSPEDSALGDLASVRQRLVDDPAQLRREAARYESAIASGQETDEHYTPLAMEWLRQADLIAAAHLEAARGQGAERSSPGAGNEAAPLTSGARTRSEPGQEPATPAPRDRPSSGARAGTGAADAPAPPVFPTGGQPGEPLVLASIGPFSNRAFAEELAARLTARGLAAVLKQIVSGPHVVMSPVLSRDVAGRRAAALSESGYPGRILLLANGRAQIEFGRFSSAAEGEALAKRIRRQGFAAEVVATGGTHFQIAVGPYAHSVIRELGRTIADLAGQPVPVSVVPAP